MIEQLAARLGATQDRQGRWHADCPMCGATARAKHGRHAYHFYLYDLAGRGRGAVCWSCGYRASLRQLANDIGAEYDASQEPAPKTVILPDPPWAVPDNWQRWQVHQSTRLDAIQRIWSSYRPFTVDTIRRAGLSVAPLQFWNDEKARWTPGRYKRLLVPIVKSGEIIGIRGRAFEDGDDGPKWISATGSTTWLCGVEEIEQGQDVVWCESLVDRWLGIQQVPSVAFVATGGLTWTTEMLEALRDRRPGRVIVWFDHDLSGNGSAYHLDEWTQQWMERMAGRRVGTPPQPRGPVLVEQLRQYGLQTHLYQWPRGTPEHADLGWVLMKEMQQ